MIMVDTFWIILRGKPVEVFKGLEPDTYHAVNPKDFSGIICRKPNEVFVLKPEIKNESQVQPKRQSCV